MKIEEREALEAIGTSLIGDALDRLNGITQFVRIDGWGGTLVGPALTVKTREGDNLAVLHAIDIAEPGQIIVVDGGGWTGRALIGDLARSFAISRGVAGFVVDGAARDVEAFQSTEPFGCFVRGISLNGPFKDGPGKVGIPIAIGGQVVAPGDIVVGDADGLVVVPHDCVGEVIAVAQARAKGEASIRAAIEGPVREQPWLQSIMQTGGSKII